jgi:hypothetical protein
MVADAWEPAAAYVRLHDYSYSGFPELRSADRFFRLRTAVLPLPLPLPLPPLPPAGPDVVCVDAAAR